MEYSLLSLAATVAPPCSVQLMKLWKEWNFFAAVVVWM